MAAEIIVVRATTCKITMVLAAPNAAWLSQIFPGVCISMPAHHRFRRGFLLLGLLALTGCGDSADSLLRIAINNRSELTDRLARVNDEASAERFNEVHMAAFSDKHKVIDEKWQKWLRDIEDDYRSKN